MDKNCLYFRGKLYKNTFRNRVVGRILTYLYKLRFLFFVCILFLCSCCSSSSLDRTTIPSHDSVMVLVFDSVHYSGHTYIVCKDANGAYRPTSPTLLHSPDCQCRYNRTFIVIKRSK